MFINKAADGKNNICGGKIAALRKSMKISQRALADKLQLSGLDIDKNAVQRIEAGKRFVTDIELLAFSEVFGADVGDLLKIKRHCNLKVTVLFCGFYALFLTGRFSESTRLPPSGIAASRHTAFPQGGRL